MKKPATPDWHGWQLVFRRGLFDGFTFGRESLNVAADELFQVPFAQHEEIAADPGKLVGSGLGHC